MCGVGPSAVLYVDWFGVGVDGIDHGGDLECDRRRDGNTDIRLRRRVDAEARGRLRCQTRGAHERQAAKRREIAERIHWGPTSKATFLFRKANDGATASCGRAWACLPVMRVKKWSKRLGQLLGVNAGQRSL